MFIDQALTLEHSKETLEKDESNWRRIADRNEGLETIYYNVRTGELLIYSQTILNYIYTPEMEEFEESAAIIYEVGQTLILKEDFENLGQDGDEFQVTEIYPDKIKIKRADSPANFVIFNSFIDQFFVKKNKY